MSVTFVVPDIHGRADLLKIALRTIGDNPIIFLGDYVDRGCGSAQVLDCLIEGQLVGKPWICLQGNHEDMMVATITTAMSRSWWYSNGGDETVSSYEGIDVDRRLKRHCEWMRKLPKWHTDKHRVYVHASVDPTIGLDYQTDDTLMWVRRDDSYSIGYQGMHVVHGHTPSKLNPRTWGDRTCLDAGAYHYGRLPIAIFNDNLAGGPVEILWAEGAVQ